MLFISIAGSSSSGKTTLSKKIQDFLGKDNCFILQMDNYYKSLNSDVDFKNYNFDVPEAFNLHELINSITCLKNQKPFNLPQYNFKTHKVDKYLQTEFYGKCVILEGIFALHSEVINKLCNIKIFVDTDLDICLLRRVKRDVHERGRTIDSILEQYEKFVKPSYYKYIMPQKQLADIIIPNGGENMIALNIIYNFINSNIST